MKIARLSGMKPKAQALEPPPDIAALKKLQEAAQSLIDAASLYGQIGQTAKGQKALDFSNMVQDFAQAELTELQAVLDRMTAVTSARGGAA